jgi:hypothetical protein
MKDHQILDNMKTLDEVFEKKDGNILSASLRDPVDPNQVVVAYGADNVAAWPEVVITADSHVKGREPVNAISPTKTKFWLSSPQSQAWLQFEFRFPIVIGLFQFCATWCTKNINYHMSGFKIEGSLDEENWFPLISEEQIDEWRPAEAKTFTCQNVRAFRFYRLTAVKTTPEGPSGVVLSGALVFKVRFSESLF